MNEPNLATGTTAPTRPPNILWLVTDQQTAAAMSCAGNPWLRTPSMDRLAARGTRFERAYCTFPLCTPSRGSMMTGCYPHQIHCDFNRGGFFWEHDFPRDHLLTRHLSTHGYDCVYAGKDMPPEDGSCGARLLCPWGDESVADHLAAFLGEHHDQPFLACGNFVNPHNICEWARQCPLPEGDVGEPEPDETLPPLPPNHHWVDDAPELLRQIQAQTIRTGFASRGVSETEWRHYIWAYHRMVEKVDALIGRVLDALDTGPHREHTLIIFTSDHGDGCGAHQWNQKNALYEESIRVPLVIAGPGVAPRRVDTDHLVSIGLDLFPTICDAAGATMPAHIRGASLLPLTRDQPPPPWRQTLVVETALASELSGDDPRRNRGRAVLAAGGHKYTVYAWGRHREQLVNLHRDPGEQHNLAADPDHRPKLDELRAALHAWAQQTGDTFPVPGHETRSPEAGLRELAAIRARHGDG